MLMQDKRVSGGTAAWPRSVCRGNYFNQKAVVIYACTQSAQQDQFLPVCNIVFFLSANNKEILTLATIFIVILINKMHFIVFFFKFTVCLFFAVSSSTNLKLLPFFLNDYNSTSIMSLNVDMLCSFPTWYFLGRSLLGQLSTYRIILIFLLIFVNPYCLPPFIYLLASLLLGQSPFSSSSGRIN